VHVDIGELYRDMQTHKELLDVGDFFYNAMFKPSKWRNMIWFFTKTPFA